MQYQRWFGVVLAMLAFAACDEETDLSDSGGDDAGAVIVDSGGDIDAAVDPDAAVLPNRAELVRDELGIPHIFAADMESAMYALGWASAEDRLFQMEFARRYAAGRMAETFGDTAQRAFTDELIEHDRYARTLGIQRNAELSWSQLPDDIPALLTAYAAGVNAAVAENGVPAIYTTLGITWEPWREEHSLMAWERVALHHQRPGIGAEITNLTDCAAGGCTVPACPFPSDPNGASTPPPADGMWPPAGTPGPGASLINSSETRGHDWREEQRFYASHGWAVHGSRISTGVSMLFGEPKLDVVAPPHWYQYHLSVADEDVDVRGAGFPGAPGVAMFWSRYTSQTITAGAGDLGDLFELTPGSAAETYVVDGVDEAYRTYDETIAVRGGADVTMTVRVSRYGPVMDEFVTGEPGDRDYALRWVEHLELDTHSIVAAIQLLRTDTLASYRDAIRHWVTPKANGIYAGRDRGDTTGPGNIAFYSLLSIPVRQRLMIGGVDMTGRHPYDGSVSNNDWSGVYDVDWNPHVVDPPEGYIVSGNNAPAGDWLDAFLYTGLNTIGGTYRSMQVRHLLQEQLPTSTSTTTPEALDAIRVDSGMWALEILRDMLQALETRGLITIPARGVDPVTREEKAGRVLQALDLWIAEGAITSPSDALGTFVISLTGNMVLSSRSATGLHCTYAHGNSAPPFILRAFDADPSLLDLDMAGFAITAASNAWDGRTTTGPDPDSWPDGPLRDWTVEVQNNWFCEQPTNPGNPTVGCSLTPADEFVVALDRTHKNTINSSVATSFPFMVQFADIDQSRALLPPGNNEDPDSEHFDSAVDAWVRLSTGEAALPLAPLTRSAITATSTRSLVYTP